MVHSDPTQDSQARAKALDLKALDALTGGAFTAATAGERAARIRAWLAGEPSPEQLVEVFKELSNRDKGAAKPLREKLDELRRARGQDALAADWAARAQTLLDAARLNLADALAWQRDAAKAGAPLSREPLAGLKVLLAERVKTIEDLQHRAQVQREAAVLIIQRTEVLSTKPWRDAQALWAGLRADVSHWREQADALVADAIWPSVDPRFPLQIESARQQLLAVWEAFEAALAQAVAAADDVDAPLPAVPVWADELRALRDQAAGAKSDKPAKPKVDPAVLAQQRAQASAAVQQALDLLKAELAQGHGKAAPKAAADLRQALKDHVRQIDAALEADAHATLTSAGELEGWQRWRADQIREELLAKAQALVDKPLGGRKQQEALRQLREQWKTGDQGGAPNHGLWKKFDEACNQAYKVVEAWLEKTREQQEASRAQRRALMDELRAWTEAHQASEDWKLHTRSLQSFEQRWRDAGHLSEKAYAEMQTQWKALIEAAQSPLQAARQQSLARRRALIDEAQSLGAQEPLRLDAVRTLQQRWQQEAQQVPIERRQEQKLWDAFRKPIDEAFARKSAEREKAAQALGEHDRRVLAAARELEQANASGDAQKIQAAAKALEAAVRGQQVAAAAAAVEPAALPPAQAPATAAEPVSQDEPAAGASAEAATEASPADEVVPAPAPVKAAPKPVIAMRGDDRPGARKPEPAARGQRPQRPGERGGRPGDMRGDRRAGDRDRFGDRDRSGERARPEERGPRLGDAAFRAQRDALEHAQQALRKLAAQAHGEVLTQLMGAWQQRDPAQIPAAQVLGKAVPAAARSRWNQVLAGSAAAEAEAAAQAMLRLEMAAELPTPAEYLPARRMMQLQLLTRRHAASPAETWGEDVAQVLAAAHEAALARRLQQALKVLLKP
jgi:ATP-dependent RNA helicase SUPV3L1/SUV3